MVEFINMLNGETQSAKDAKKNVDKTHKRSRFKNMAIEDDQLLS